MRIGTKAVDAQQTARQLFSSMKSGDEAALFAFDTQLQKVSDFTTDFKGLESKFEGIEQPFGQTSLYDAIAETAKAVAKAAGGHGRVPQRSAIVVLYRRHRHEEPADGTGSVGDSEQHRCSGLCRRGDVARGRSAEPGLRRRRAEQRAHRPGALDGRKIFLSRSLRRTRASRPGRSSVKCATSTCSRSKPRREVAGDRWKCKHEIANKLRAREKWLHRGGWSAIPGRGAAAVEVVAGKWQRGWHSSGVRVPTLDAVHTGGAES